MNRILITGNSGYIGSHLSNILLETGRFEVNVCPRREGDLERSVLDDPSKFMKQIYTIDELLKYDL